MGLDTNFNQDPYFDDYNEDKGFHRILFKPGVAVQARELTQLQTILQTQIERFGDNILKEGTIVKGCAFGYLNRQPYVKIRDLQQDGQPVVMTNYEGLRAVGLTSGVEAYIVKTSSGLESQYATTGTNTLHVRYVKSNGANTNFSTTEYIRLENYRTGTTVTTVEAAGNVTGIGATAIGNGTALRVSEGIIYQKGMFIAVDKQLAIISRYDVAPHNLAAGFVVAETIINSNNDTSLLDNAAGYNNVNAPGADRIQLSPVLTVKSVANAIADENFFTLVEYQNGVPVRRKETTQYSVIGEEFARRTAEESGDYAIRNFPLSIWPHANSSIDILFTRIGPGVAYVEGKRVETFGPIDIPLFKSTSYKAITDQNVTTNLGNYIIVDDFKGDIPFNEFATIDLYDAAQDARSSDKDMTQSPFPATGNFIGTAKVRSVEHHEGTIGTAAAKYKLYLFDINVSNTSHTFADTRGVVYEGSGVDGAADIVTERSRAVLKDETFKTTLWDIGRPAIQTLDNADFVYRTVTEGSAISGGTATVSFALSGNDTWPYGASATLNTTQKNEIVLVANNSDVGPTNYYEGRHIDLTNATVTTSADAQTLTITGLGTATGASVYVKAYHNANHPTTSGNPKGKDLDTYYVEVLANTAPDGIGGTYSLGLPDVYEIQAVYYNSSGQANTSSTDVTANFRLYRNQRDAYYGLSYVRKNSLLSLASNGGLLFKIRAFTENTTQGIGFFSVDSYGSSFANLNYEDIPSYLSERGDLYDLRNSIDFRPYAQATVAYSTTEAGAPTCTTSVTASPTFASGEKYTPAPNKSMEIDYKYYLGRIDKLYVDSDGRFQMIAGLPSENPIQPQDPAKGLVLATVMVPPYPSLTSVRANRTGKPFHATKIKMANVTRGYTMKDIGQLDRRIKQLEYYTVLNSLETEAKDKGILDASGNDRFKNGIFSDSFEDLSFSKAHDIDFGASLDPAYKELAPKIDQYDMDLQVSTVNNATEFQEGVLLNMSDVAFIQQPYATKGRTTAEDELMYVGIMTLYPNYDPGYDVTVTPDFNLEIDILKPFVDFTTALNNYVPLTSVKKSVASQTSTRIGYLNNVAGTLNTTTSTTTEIVKKLQVGKDSETDTHVGDFVTDIRFNPFMKSKEIAVNITGVRPNTRLYFFFDNQNVDGDVAPAVAPENSLYSLKDFRRSNIYGSAITSDSRGRAKAIFRIAPSTYFVGTKKLKVYDVSSLNNVLSESKTSASAEYHAFNYSVQKQGINVSTRTPKIHVAENTIMNTVTSEIFRPYYINDYGGDGGGWNPPAPDNLGVAEQGITGNNLGSSGFADDAQAANASPNGGAIGGFADDAGGGASSGASGHGADDQGAVCLSENMMIFLNGKLDFVTEARIGNRIGNTFITDVVHKHMRKGYYIINGELEITNDHPVLVNNNWKRVDALIIGDRINNVEVFSIDYIDRITPTVYIETASDQFDVFCNNNVYTVHGRYRDFVQKAA